jgi:hypothetical protein
MGMPRAINHFRATVYDTLNSAATCLNVMPRSYICTNLGFSGGSFTVITRLISTHPPTPDRSTAHKDSNNHAVSRTRRPQKHGTDRCKPDRNGIPLGYRSFQVTQNEKCSAIDQPLSPPLPSVPDRSPYPLRTGRYYSVACSTSACSALLLSHPSITSIGADCSRSRVARCSSVMLA